MVRRWHTPMHCEVASSHRLLVRQTPSGRRANNTFFQARYRQSRAKTLRELKNKPCADCGLKYLPCVMHFDHVRGKKEFNVSVGNVTYRPQRILAEIAKCDLVCANCHAIRTFQRSQNKRMEKFST